MICNLFLKQGLYFINSEEVRLHRELSKLLQTMGGDRSKHEIDPGPNSNQHEQDHVHPYYKIVVHGHH